MATANARIYRPLEPTQSRLIHLPPGENDDPITCSLEPFNTLDPPPYTALSYVWGDPKITAPITVGGHAFQVTTNLEIALRHIRLKKEARTLWIDAIAINQLDMEERAQQVAMMADIYRNAELVLVWLGPADEYSTLFFKFLKGKRSGTLRSLTVAWTGRAALVDMLDKNKKSGSLWRHRGTRGFRKLISLYSFSVFLARLHVSASAVVASYFIRKQWFSRRWCIQERALANEVIVQCGADFAGWSDMHVVFCEARYGSLLLDASLPTKYKRLEGKINAVATFFPQDNYPSVSLHRRRLPELLWAFRHWQNENPKDTVYGLLALVESQHATIMIDYTRTDVDVLVDVVEYTLCNDNDLNLIGVPWAPSIPGLPSWIVPTPSGFRCMNEIPFGKSSSLYVYSHTNDTFCGLRWKSSARILRQLEDAGTSPVLPTYTLLADGITLHICKETTTTLDLAGIGEILFGWPYDLTQFELWSRYWKQDIHDPIRKPGDRVVVLFGCNHILILRPVEAHFVLVESWLGHFWDFLTSDQHSLEEEVKVFRNRISEFVKDLPTETFTIV